MNELKHKDIMVGMKFLSCDVYRRSKEKFVYKVIHIYEEGGGYMVASDYSYSNGLLSLFQLNKMDYLGLSKDPIPQRGWVECLATVIDQGAAVFKRGERYPYFGYAPKDAPPWIDEYPNESGILVQNAAGSFQQVHMKDGFKILDPTHEGEK